MVARNSAGLDVAVVVDAALAIADTDGVDKLSMRALAGRLKVTPMAIYHHVRNKEELLDLIADESLRALIDLDVPDDLETGLVTFFTAFHRLHLAHPALAHVMSQRPIEGPTATLLGEELFGALIDAGIDDDRAANAMVSLVNFTLGTSLYRMSRSGRHFGALPQAPTANRLRDSLEAAAVDEAQFIDGLQRLVRSYLT